MISVKHDQRGTGEPARRGWRTRKAREAAARRQFTVVVARLREVEQWLDTLEYGPEEIDVLTHEQMLLRVRDTLRTVDRMRNLNGHCA